MRTDGQANMKLIVAFRNFAKAPKNGIRDGASSTHGLIGNTNNISVGKAERKRSVGNLCIGLY